MMAQPCKRCLLRDMTDAAYYQSLRDYLAALPEEKAADSALYARRIAQCENCDELASGLCRQCGCFVEMRAAVKQRACPLPRPKW